MVDDDEEDFLIIRDLLRDIRPDKYEIDWAEDFASGMLDVLKKQHDVYLIDYRLGPDNGLDLIRQAIASGVDYPLILMTGQNDRVIDEMALEAGASDYLVKGSFSAHQLENAIRYSVEHGRNLREIRELNTELEKRVRNRTLVLEQALEELQHSREELKNALEKEKVLNELKSRFVSMASHEFRTPLATILSSVSLIGKYAEMGNVENQGKHITRIKSAVNHLTELLDDMLSLSKLEEGKINLQLDCLQVDKLTENIVNDLRTLTKPGQRIITSHHGESEIVCDAKVIKIMISNLGSNAVKFSPENSDIYITTSTTKDTFTLKVQDRGIGIPESDKKHLFERFFRAGNVTNIEGTGLGLNIIAKYVELLKGKISIESKENEGSTFTITLPRFSEIHEEDSTD